MTHGTFSNLMERCPLCSSQNLKDIFAINGFAISKCRRCRFYFVRNEMTAEEVAEYYKYGDDNVYIDNSNLDNLSFYYKKLKAEIEKRTQSGKILDIGCSGGHFLDVMTGWDRYGIEISPASLIAREKYGAHVSQDTLHRGQWAAGFFDVITLLDSFDHMQNPLDVLSICRELLKPGGLIVVKVHDISSLFARACGSRYYALLPPYHLSYFSPSTLRFALQKRDFSPVGHMYVPHVLFLRTIFDRLSRGDQSSPFSKIHDALHGTALGNLRIRKNVFDIMTMFAVAT